MAISQITVGNADEVSKLLGLVVTLVKDIKAGKGALGAGADLVPQLAVALSSISEVGAELKANKQVVEETVARSVADLVAALTGA